MFSMIKFIGHRSLLVKLNYEYNPDTYYWEKELKHKKTRKKIKCCINDDNVIAFIGDKKYCGVFLQELGSDNYVFL